MTRPSISDRAKDAKPAAPPAAPASPVEAPKRPVRRPFGLHVQKLAYEARAGYHRHWFSDKPGRIADAQAAGYEHVLDPTTKEPVNRVVDVNETGGAMKGYLMEIPQEWYDEDMAAQQALVDERDNAIRRGAVGGNPGEDGRYIPRQGISIKGR